MRLEGEAAPQGAAATQARSSFSPMRSSKRRVTCPTTWDTWAMSSIWPSSMARLGCGCFSTASTRTRPFSALPTMPMTLLVPTSRA